MHARSSSSGVTGTLFPVPATATAVHVTSLFNPAPPSAAQPLRPALAPPSQLAQLGFDSDEDDGMAMPVAPAPKSPEKPNCKAVAFSLPTAPGRNVDEGAFAAPATVPVTGASKARPRQQDMDELVKHKALPAGGDVKYVQKKQVHAAAAVTAAPAGSDIREDKAADNADGKPAKVAHRKRKRSTSAKSNHDAPSGDVDEAPARKRARKDAPTVEGVVIDIAETAVPRPAQVARLVKETRDKQSKLSPSSTPSAVGFAEADASIDGDSDPMIRVSLAALVSATGAVAGTVYTNLPPLIVCKTVYTIASHWTQTTDLPGPFSMRGVLTDKFVVQERTYAKNTSMYGMILEQAYLALTLEYEDGRVYHGLASLTSDIKATRDIATRSIRMCYGVLHG